MKKPNLRIPYTGPLPPPIIVPRSANTLAGAVDALHKFLSGNTDAARGDGTNKAVLLTGAGISVASGLADYRGTGGTYTLNKTYRPIYFHEFVTSHEARKRYWARSFLGWTTLHRARPNIAHFAVRDLGSMGIVNKVITQNVDSFHSTAHPNLETIELHGYLRSLVCLTCRNELPRSDFQRNLAALNPAWATFLEEMLSVGALNSENPEERTAKGLKSNPDGDVDVPDAPYTTFRYPACLNCLENAPFLSDGTKAVVNVDNDGAWSPGSTAGVLKPAVVMFGESINEGIKTGAEKAIDDAARILIVGSSLATYSAWRLVKKAKDQGKPIAIVNLGGVRGEEAFFSGVPLAVSGDLGMRCNESASKVLPLVVDSLKASSGARAQIQRHPSELFEDQKQYEWTPMRTPS